MAPLRDVKAFASLSSTLLARKGQARPAMRPQGFDTPPAAASPNPQDDLGWNDMGDDHAPFAPLPPVAAPEPVPAVVRQQEEIASSFASPVPSQPIEAEPAAEAPPLPAETASDLPGAVGLRRAAGLGPKAAFTLRLDPDRHLRLRLASATRHRSAQLLMIEALDALLAGMPDVDQLAAAARKDPGKAEEISR